jgi:tryptophan 2,3-dioxygenase
MSLLPASGFQSAQYRMIEIASTALVNLLDEESRKQVKATDSIHQQMEKIYWRSGATELASGKKTLTLQQFEEKYLDTFCEQAERSVNTNLNSLYQKHFATRDEGQQIKERLRELDVLANVKWRLAHLRSAGRYLQKSPEDIKATGGTNWQKYLPPRFQKIMFFPELWTEEEKANWGRAAFEH